MRANFPWELGHVLRTEYWIPEVVSSVAVTASVAVVRNTLWKRYIIGNETKGAAC